MNIPTKFALMIEEGRRAQRQTLIWKGVLRHDNQSHQVRVRNISATGAMIESPARLRVGTGVLLELSDSISIPATVQWSVGYQLGVSFQAPFDLSLLTQTRPVTGQAAWAPPSYLDRAVQAAWERRLRRLSPKQLRDEFKGYIRD